MLVLHWTVVHSAVLTVPLEFASLQAALDAAAVGDIINVNSGTYTGTGNCGVTLKTDGVTVAGAGKEVTIFACNSSVAIPLVVSGENVRVQDLGYINIGLDAIGTGLLYVTASQVIVTNVTFKNGLAKSPPTDYSWRGTNGGAVLVAASEAPVRLYFRGVSFINNSAVCTVNTCYGGAVSIQISSAATSETYSSSAGAILSEDCLLQSNTVLGYEKADGLQGAGVSIQDRGNASVTVDVVNSSFVKNSMRNSGTPVTATGGALSFINIDFATSSVFSRNFTVFILNSTFQANQIESEQCNSLSLTTANGAAAALFGTTSINILTSLFANNTVACNADISSASSGIAEGGALFIQGLYAGNPDSLQPVVNISGSDFHNNMATCLGTGCLSLGGAIAVAIADFVYLSVTEATGNRAVCSGVSCGSQGGFIQLQNGPAVSVGAVAHMNVVSSLLRLSNNIAEAVSAGNYVTPCDTESASCNNPVYGGAVALLAWNGALDLLATQWAMNENRASCANDVCTVFGADVGGGVFTLSGGITATSNMELSSSSFSCSNVSCVDDAADCLALHTTWSTSYYTAVPDGLIDINGDNCIFVGSQPPTGHLVDVSSSCDTSESVDYSVCFVSNQPPTLAPTMYSVPSVQPTSVAGSNSVTVTLGRTSVIIVVTCGCGVMAMFVGGVYYYYHVLSPGPDVTMPLRENEVL
jgi:hypothetical protein